MNYYEQHIGDYAKDAGHLSMIEDGAYRRLMDAYYTRERALPSDPRECCKLARATTKPERDAVAYVLREFFTLADDGYHQKRCDEEIERYFEAEPERARKRENAKERQQRARARRSELFEQLRLLGITPAWDASTHALEAQLSRVTKGDMSQPVTRDNTATTPHSPLPNKSQDQKPSRTPTDPAPTGTEAGRACGLMRQAGCVRVNPSNPNLLAALAEGVTAEALRDTYLEDPSKNNPFAWAIATARSRHAEGARTLPTPSARASPHAPPAMSKTLQVLHKLEVAKNGTGLDYPRDQQRLAEADSDQP